jgi:hypothetical protein
MPEQKLGYLLEVEPGSPSPEATWKLASFQGESHLLVLVPGDSGQKQIEVGSKQRPLHFAAAWVGPMPVPETATPQSAVAAWGARHSETDVVILCYSGGLQVGQRVDLELVAAMLQVVEVVQPLGNPACSAIELVDRLMHFEQFAGAEHGTAMPQVAVAAAAAAAAAAAVRARGLSARKRVARRLVETEWVDQLRRFECVEGVEQGTAMAGAAAMTGAAATAQGLAHHGQFGWPGEPDWVDQQQHFECVEGAEHGRGKPVVVAVAAVAQKSTGHG